MNILVIHETEYIDKMIYEYQVIPELLATLGHRVNVIDFPTNWKRKNLFDLISQEIRNTHISKTHKQKGITLHRPAFIKLPLLSRISAFFYYFLLIQKTIKTYNINMIFLYGVATNGLQSVFLSRMYKVPIVFRLLDVAHQIVPSRALSLPTYILEKIVYNNVTQLYAITPKLREYAIKMGSRRESTFFIPTGSDKDLFFFQKKDKHLLAKYQLKSTDTVLLFSGTLYNFSGLDRIITEFPYFLKKIKNLKLVVVGNGEQYFKLKEMVERLRLREKIIFTGYQEYSLLPKLINLADICINPFKQTKTTELIIPSKIYQYLACGKPVLATKLSGMLDIFPDIGGKNGLYYYKDPDSFYENILRINHAVKDNNSSSLQDIVEILENKMSKILSSSAG